ncbi:sensor histidine kinase [Cohnella faecalis]|uniref:HAMP domain-containing protein n=1 Tax=Cohnella faecalis TaxID=2315694 RepID=A0A398CN81_9BACL|nr:histidine kinase [Cohnella faecalis]RIE03690.1 HAMP domain-containing protein [Cohnella faecalis]
MGWIGWIRNSSIAKSIMGGFLAFMIPVLLFSFILNSKSIDTAQSEVTKSYQNSVVLLARQMDDRVSAMSKLVNSLFTDTNILYMNYKDETDAAQLLAYANLMDRLKFYANASLLNGEIRVYLRNKGKSFSSLTGYGDINELDKREALDLGADKTGHWRMDGDGLSFVQNPLYSRENKGIVVMARIEQSELMRFLDNLNATEPEGVPFLADINGNWVFSQKGGRIDKASLFRKLNDRNSDADQFVFTDDKRDYRVIYGKSASSGLVVGMYFSERYAMRIVTGHVWLMAAFSAMAALLSLLFTWILFSRLLRPFRDLVEGMRKVGRGDFRTRLERIPEKDFAIVFRHFNKMVSDTERLINEVYVERLNSQSFQLKLLQSRINPHFLNNCLNFVYQASMGENHEGAARMASHLAKYFRDMAKGYRDMITLREECDNVTTLVEIQNMRFNGRIDFRPRFEDDLGKHPVPSLIVQPLVENAILHGLIPGKERLHIRVVARKEPEGITIAVEDDGPGIPPEKLDEIRRQTKSSELDRLSIGLNNIYWRLKLNYGDRADLKLDNVDSGGLRVTLVFGDGTPEEKRNV